MKATVEQLETQMSELNNQFNNLQENWSTFNQSTAIKLEESLNNKMSKIADKLTKLYSKNESEMSYESFLNVIGR
jgi:hypothetical protein